MFGWAGRPLTARVEEAAAARADVIDQLTRLGALARQGLLTSEEFAAVKARLLGT